MIDLAASPFFDDTHTERVEEPGAYYHAFEFSMPGNHPAAEYAVPKGEVIFRDPGDQVRAFVIKSVSDETGPNGSYKRVFAEDAAQDELMSLVKMPSTDTTKSATELLSGILAGSRWQAGIVESPATTTLTKTWEDYETRWEAVLWVSREFGLEINTRVTVRGNAIVARYIDLVQQRGIYIGKVFYDRNTASIKREGDGGEVYTAAIGIGDDGTMFTATVWSTDSGDPVNKPADQVYVADDDARLGRGDNEAYGIRLSDGTFAHRMGVFRFEEANASRLLTKTWAALQERTTPQYTYEVQMLSIEQLPPQQPGDADRGWERVNIGDMVVVRDRAVYPPYTSEARVTEVRRCYSDPTRDSVTLGKPAATRISDYIKDSLRYMRRTP